MRRMSNCMVAIIFLLCTATVQVVADDVCLKQVPAIRSVDMELYTFYMKHSQGLELCCATCPAQSETFENASGIFAVLLDDAVSSIRGQYNDVVDFQKLDSVLLTSSKKTYSQSAGCTPCSSLAKKIQTYSESGLPTVMARTVLLHTEKYIRNPELEFNDGLVSTARYQWVASGKRRTCRVSIPKTWGRVGSDTANRSFEYRSALGTGIPFFSIQYVPAKRVRSDEGIMQELQGRVSAEVLKKQFGGVEILAQGIQRLGDIQGIWVMFSAKGKGDRSAGYYYNWYMLVDGTVLVFQSGVCGSSKFPTIEQEQMFRKYYQTLREIAVSSVIG
ncbi:hypothetical protein ACQ0P8_14640 [Halodesulfovibrio aestuarii]|uniref:Uncharacterized protein n=1 Tax=Halodesulfovibrio aestuarii TaxID=126333 RepID=A0A8G2C9X8_9BACT|nr:hypothetical protein [Halodesulfovibrio aestuarii]SHJ22773.1 hypothetical protein SAMN05660830_01862 [Halodesulfovibrio aestuarii]